jgi:hypothetical protein
MVAFLLCHLMHIDNGSIGDAPNAVEPGAAFAFQLSGAFGLSPQERVDADNSNRTNRYYQRIKTK